LGRVAHLRSRAALLAHPALPRLLGIGDGTLEELQHGLLALWGERKRKGEGLGEKGGGGGGGGRRRTGGPAGDGWVEGGLIISRNCSWLACPAGAAREGEGVSKKANESQYVF
jgi:hypothetical protein